MEALPSNNNGRNGGGGGGGGALSAEARARLERNKRLAKAKLLQAKARENILMRDRAALRDVNSCIHGGDSAGAHVATNLNRPSPPALQHKGTAAAQQTPLPRPPRSASPSNSTNTPASASASALPAPPSSSSTHPTPAGGEGVGATRTAWVVVGNLFASANTMGAATGVAGLGAHQGDKPFDSNVVGAAKAGEAEGTETRPHATFQDQARGRSSVSPPTSSLSQLHTGAQPQPYAHPHPQHQSVAGAQMLPSRPDQAMPPTAQGQPQPQQQVHSVHATPQQPLSSAQGQAQKHQVRQGAQQAHPLPHQQTQSAPPRPQQYVPGAPHGHMHSHQQVGQGVVPQAHPHPHPQGPSVQAPVSPQQYGPSTGQPGSIAQQPRPQPFVCSACVRFCVRARGGARELRFLHMRPTICVRMLLLVKRKWRMPCTIPTTIRAEHCAGEYHDRAAHTHNRIHTTFSSRRVGRPGVLTHTNRHMRSPRG